MDNLDYGELGVYGGGLLRGAPTRTTHSCEVAEVDVCDALSFRNLIDAICTKRMMPRGTNCEVMAERRPTRIRTTMHSEPDGLPSPDNQCRSDERADQRRH